MNPFHQYLENLLADHLKKRRVAVWYDPRGEFRPFVNALALDRPIENGLAQVTIGAIDATLARFNGSFFEVKAAVEPLVEADKPAPLVVYLGGVTQDKGGSVLMELEKGGYCFEWKLKSQARFCLRDKFTDGVIDGMLAPENIGYDDVVSFLAQGDGETPSVLRTLFDGSKENADLIAGFLVDPSRDARIVEKGADDELFQLMASRLGLSIESGTRLEDARQRALRYVLVNEFRADLSCDPPASVAMIGQTQNLDQTALVRKTAEAMREKHPDVYEGLADGVSKELDLAAQPIAAEHLGKVDTFRFEEAVLLSHAGERIRLGRYDDALQVVQERKRSFWVDRSLARQAQWEACRLMARLGVRVNAVRQEIKKRPEAPERWVSAYCREDGWHRMDRAQHALEAWVAKMDEEPENEAALETVRQAYEDLLQEMAGGFVEALSRNNWSVGDFLSQTNVYADVVAQEKAQTAYFLVDAMRFAMAAELAGLLSVARDVVLRPAVAAWPTITPVGMAALLPGAENGFCLVDDRDELAARVEGTPLSNLAARMKFLKARVPGAVEMQLEKLLEMSSGKLEKAIGQAPLIVIRSQEIDALGELAGSLVARQLMDTMVGNVARAVKKLASAGVPRFVITADHGHLFTRKKEDAFKTDPPGGKTLDIHRRCWIGYGGSTPPGTVRLSGAQMGYATDLEFVFPKGIGVFKTGGDLGFHHGGLSLQEMLVPVLTLKLIKEKKPEGPGGEVQLLGEPLEIANRTFGIQLVLGGLFDVKPFTVRPLLLSKGVIVGKAGMAMEAEYVPETGDVILQPKKKAGVAMILEIEDVERLQVVIQDPATDRVLAQSKDINVKLGTR